MKVTSTPGQHLHLPQPDPPKHRPLPPPGSSLLLSPFQAQGGDRGCGRGWEQAHCLRWKETQLTSPLLFLEYLFWGGLTFR